MCGVMGVNMLANGLRIRWTALVHINGRTGVNKEVTGKITLWKELESTIGQTAGAIKASTIRIKSMAMVFTHGRMAESMRAIGLVDDSTVWALIWFRHTHCYSLVSGRTVLELIGFQTNRSQQLTIRSTTIQPTSSSLNLLAKFSRMKFFENLLGLTPTYTSVK